MNIEFIQFVGFPRNIVLSLYQYLFEYIGYANKGLELKLLKRKKFYIVVKKYKHFATYTVTLKRGGK